MQRSRPPLMLALILLLALIFLAGPSSAATKAYSSSAENGLPGDTIGISTNICPPIQATPGDRFGFAILDDDDAGSVSLEVSTQGNRIVDLDPTQLSGLFGPGAFVFLTEVTSITNVPPGGSVHLSSPGSGTDPGEAAVWGIVSGWSMSGSAFCVSSPSTLCNQNGFSHGVTVQAKLGSGTFNLGTWTFDTEGDYEAITPYIERTTVGGTANSQLLLRGAFQGSTLPALPLVGFGTLMLSLAVIGGRSLMDRK